MGIWVVSLTSKILDGGVGQELASDIWEGECIVPADSIEDAIGKAKLALHDAQLDVKDINTCTRYPSKTYENNLEIAEAVKQVRQSQHIHFSAFRSVAEQGYAEQNLLIG